MAGLWAASPLLRRERYLEYLTLGWNVVGAAIIGVAAVGARSVALAGFGLDSRIEIFASFIVVWQRKIVGHDRERTALRLIGGACFALALCVLAQALFTFLTRAQPAQSPGGIAWLAGPVADCAELSSSPRIAP